MTMQSKLTALVRSAAAIIDMRDVFAFSGLGMSCYGLAQVYAPAAWIAGGAVFFWLGVRR